MKNKLDNVESKIISLINCCNNNFGSRRLNLECITNGVYHIKVDLHDNHRLILSICNDKMQINYDNITKLCNISNYKELENFISMILLPYFIYGDQLYLDIIETSTGYKRVRDCSGLEAVLFTHSIVLGVQLNMIELTNAKLTKDNKIIITDKSEFLGESTKNNIRVDNSW